MSDGNIHPGDIFIAKSIFPGKYAEDLGLIEITSWREKKCSCDTPVALGGSTNFLGATREENPRRCLTCFGTFDANTMPFETHPARGHDADEIAAAVKSIDDTCRELCTCKQRAFDRKRPFKFGEIVRCTVCGRIAGKISVTN